MRRARAPRGGGAAPAGAAAASSVPSAAADRAPRARPASQVLQMLQEVASARRVALLELTDNGFLEKEKARRAQKRQQRLEEAGGADGGSRDEGAGAAAAAESGVEVRRAGAGEGGEALPAPKARRGDGTSAGEDAAPAVTQRERRAPSAAGSKKERKRTGKVDKKA